MKSLPCPQRAPSLEEEDPERLLGKGGRRLFPLIHTD